MARKFSEIVAANTIPDPAGSMFLAAYDPGSADPSKAGMIPYQSVIDLTENALGFDVTGATDQTAAIQAVIDAAGSWSRIILPAGDLLVLGNLTVTQPGVSVEGASYWSTRIIFEPTVSGVCLQWTLTQSPGACRNLWFYSTNPNDVVMTAVEYIDGSGFLIENLLINGPTNSWWGDSTKESVGISTKGRECNRFVNIRIFADRPVRLRENPNTYLDVDQFHFTDTYLVPNPLSYHANIEADDDVNIFNLTIDGFNAWARGNCGFKWDSPNADRLSHNIKISGIRHEQGIEAAADGYVIYINHAYGIQNLIIENVYGDIGFTNGVYIKGGQHTRMSDLRITTSGGPPLEIIDGGTVTCQSLEWTNCTWGAGGDTSIITDNLILVEATPQWDSNFSLPTKALYRRKQSATYQEKGQIVADGPVTEHTIAASVNPRVSGTDISFDSAKTITSVAGGFTGILDGHKVYVLGSAGNTAQFTVNGNATDTVITVDEAVVTESAGPSITIVHGVGVPHRGASTYLTKTDMSMYAASEASADRSNHIICTAGKLGAGTKTESNSSVFSANDNAVPDAVGSNTDCYFFSTIGSPAIFWNNRTSVTNTARFLARILRW